MENHPVHLAKIVMFPQYAMKTYGRSYSAVKGVWTKLIRRSIISENNLMFNEQVQIGEDGLLELNVLKKQTKLSLLMSIFTITGWIMSRRQEDADRILKMYI